MSCLSCWSCNSTCAFLSLLSIPIPFLHSHDIRSSHLGKSLGPALIKKIQTPFSSYLDISHHTKIAVSSWCVCTCWPVQEFCIFTGSKNHFNSFQHKCHTTTIKNRPLLTSGSALNVFDIIVETRPHRKSEVSIMFANSERESQLAPVRDKKNSCRLLVFNTVLGSVHKGQCKYSCELTQTDRPVCSTVRRGQGIPLPRVLSLAHKL